LDKVCRIGDKGGAGAGCLKMSMENHTGGNEWPSVSPSPEGFQLDPTHPRRGKMLFFGFSQIA